VLQGLLTLLSHRWRDTDALFAKALADTVVALFYDNDNGGFYFAGTDQPALIFNPKPSFDEALPPGNAVLTQALVQLGQLLGDTTYLDAATNTLRWARAAMERYPANHCGLISALQFDANALTVVLRGPLDEMTQWRDALISGYSPWLKIYCLPYDIGGPVPDYLPGLVSAATRAEVSAFVFADGQASQPISELTALKQALGLT